MNKEQKENLKEIKTQGYKIKKCLNLHNGISIFHATKEKEFFAFCEIDLLPEYFDNLIILM